MARSRQDQGKKARLAPLQFEGLAVRLANDRAAVTVRVADAQRIARALGLSWRASAIDERARTVLLQPGPRSRRPSVAQAWELAHRLRAHRDVVFAEPAFVMPGEGPFVAAAARRAARVARRRCRGRRTCDWALELCKVPAAWGLPPAPGGAGLGQSILVAHPDTGWTAHPELANTAVDGGGCYDFVADDDDPLDPLDPPNPGHGTSTASVHRERREPRRRPARDGRRADGDDDAPARVVERRALLVAAADLGAVARDRPPRARRVDEPRRSAAELRAGGGARRRRSTPT